MSNIDLTDIHTALAHVGEQNLIEEDISETHRQKHVRRDQAKGHDTSNQAPVNFQLGQHVQQGRNQQRDEGDMNRQDVLRGDRDHQQQANQ